MLILSIFLGIFLGGAFASCITVWALVKSNEIGNSKGTMSDMDGYVEITSKQDNVDRNYPLG